MSIVIGCDSFLALRNVRNGQLGQLLNEHHVVVWVDPHQLAGSRIMKPEGVELGSLEDFDPRTDPQLGSMLTKQARARKCYCDPATMWVAFRESSVRNHRSSRLRRTASIGKAAGRLAGYWIAGQLGLAQRWRQEFETALREHPVTDLYRRRLREVGAEVVAGFSPEGFREMALIEAANSLDIPTIVMIRSRDNLAAKIPYLPYAETYLVWSDATKRFLLHLHPEISAERIQVTGSPQFDHHLDSSYRLGREEFFGLVGLDPSRPLIVFSMATPGLIDHEIEIAQHLADVAHSGGFVGKTQLLVRGHPRMFGSNVKLLHREYPEARAYPKTTTVEYKSSEHEAQVVRLVLEDEPVHLATLTYQDVQVNTCGTMTVDAAILDKPVVNVYYDLVHGILSGMSVRRFYERSDVRHMMSYGASRLARDPERCIRLINQYLVNPRLDSEGRRRAREGDCGPLDGQAGRRVAGALARTARVRTQRACDDELQYESGSAIS